MREKRYSTNLAGITRIKWAVKKYRTSDEPDDAHELAAKDLVETLERWSVHPDLKWASYLLIGKLWGHGLCKQGPLGDGVKSIFSIEWQVVASAFRAAAAKKNRN